MFHISWDLKQSRKLGYLSYNSLEDEVSIETTISVIYFSLLRNILRKSIPMNGK